MAGNSPIASDNTAGWRGLSSCASAGSKTGGRCWTNWFEGRDFQERTDIELSGLPKRLRGLRARPAPLPLALGSAGGQPGNVVVHEERVDDERGGGAEESPGHDLTPVEHIALDQRGDDADRQHQLLRRCGEGERVKKLRPRHSEGEDGRRDEAGQRYRDEDAGENLPIVRAVHQRG